MATAEAGTPPVLASLGPRHVRSLVGIRVRAIGQSQFGNYEPGHTGVITHVPCADLAQVRWDHSGEELNAKVEKLEQPSAVGPSSGPTTNAADQAEAASMRVGGGDVADDGRPAASSVLDSLVSVKIDENATQKYVLIEATIAAELASKHLVRGDQCVDYHKEVARTTTMQLERLGIRYNVLGGGRIKHDSASQKIEIYGFSYGFPWADEPRHDLSAEAVKAAFPGFDVTTSNEGY